MSGRQLTGSSKSKLRQKEPKALGPQYRGVRISRATLEESSDEDEEEKEEDDGSGEDTNGSDGETGSASDTDGFDDPDTADLLAPPDDDNDAEIDSDEALGESDAERFKDFVFRGSSKPRIPKGKRSSRPVAADFLPPSDDSDGETQPQASADSDQDSMEVEDGPEKNGQDDSVEDSESDHESDESETGEPSRKDGRKSDQHDERAQLRDMFGQGQKQVVATITEAAKADAEKGAAVRHQRRTFDSILNLRIRLQKALVAVNSLHLVDNTESVDEEPYKAAEEAAVKLWNTIGSLRDSILPETTAGTGEKRKREIELDTPLEGVWETMETTEEFARSYRRKILDRWSAKVRPTAASDRSRQLKDSSAQSLVSVLEDQLLSADRLVKRTKVPRSCAPLQASRKVAEDVNIYDDADFYQLLLKELVEQRDADSCAPGNKVITVQWAALKEAKTRKQVDRKASKGRKLRYTVHEKLQNFMAPEDRRTWEDEAIDSFFGTLFGRKMELREDAEDGPDRDMAGVKVGDDSLQLFRS